MNREINAVVYNGSSVQEHLSSALELDQQQDNGQGLAAQCSGLIGDEKYECLCQDQQPGTRLQKCIQDKKKADEAAAKEQKKNQNKPQIGPPRVIHMEVQ